jgi:hypothetical protein
MSLDPRTTPPLRWLDPDSDAPAEVRTTLHRAARVEEPTSRITRLEQRLLPLLGGPPIATVPELPALDLAAGGTGAGSTAAPSAVGTAVPSAAASAGGALTTGAIVKVVAAIAVVGGIGTGVHMASKSEKSQRVAVTTTQPAATRPSATQPSAKQPSVPPRPTAQSSAIHPSAAGKPVPKPPASVPPAVQESTPVSTLKDEAALLSRAHAVSQANPAAALEFLREHARRFPSGTLAQERELFLIELLARSGQTQAAARRLRAFEAWAPNSPHLARARGFVEKAAPEERTAPQEK